MVLESIKDQANGGLNDDAVEAVGSIGCYVGMAI
jgi:hypothetical protein